MRWPSWWWPAAGNRAWWSRPSGRTRSRRWPTPNPDLSTGLLLAPWFDPQEAVTTAVARGCRAVHPHIDLVTESLIDQAHGAGLSVAAWTVNDRSALEAAGRAGVDTVITDDVGLALGTLRP